MTTVTSAAATKIAEALTEKAQARIIRLMNVVSENEETKTDADEQIAKAMAEIKEVQTKLEADIAKYKAMVNA